MVSQDKPLQLVSLHLAIVSVSDSKIVRDLYQNQLIKYPYNIDIRGDKYKQYVDLIIVEIKNRVLYARYSSNKRQNCTILNKEQIWLIINLLNKNSLNVDKVLITLDIPDKNGKRNLIITT